MSRAFDRMRGYVYPRSHVSGVLNSLPQSLHASNVILGMLLVMLSVLATARAMTFASAAF